MVRTKQNQAVPADHGAEATTVSELEKLKVLRERLFDSSFDGIIIADMEGDLLDCNQATEEIFEMKAEQMRGVNVRELYYDPEEPAKIGRMLSQAEDGKLRDYQTYVKNRYGNKIPITLSASWLYDQEKGKIGSVGYFRDLRSAHKDERYLKLLQDTNQIVAEAEGLDKGLEKLVENIVHAFLVSFASILLLDEKEKTLVVKSASAIEREEPLAWNSIIGKNYSLAARPELERIIDQGEPTIFRSGEDGGGKFVRFLENELGWQDRLQSALVVPFKTQSNKVGVSIIGEMRSWQRRPFTGRDLELARTMAVQLAALIEKIKLHEQVRQQLDETDRRNQLLSALDESSRHIRAERERSRLLHEIVRMSAELLDCPAGYMLLNHRVIEELEVVAVYGLPDDWLGERIPNHAGFAGEIVGSGEQRIVRPFESTNPADEILISAGLKSVIGTPIKEMGAVEAVLVIGDRQEPRQFSPMDLDILKRLLIQASIALQTSRLIGKEQRVYAQLSILKTISDYIQSAQDLETILHVVLTGVTAVYGLRFNRAALLLLSNDKSSLVGYMGIGEIERERAIEDWKEHHRQGLDTFDNYLKALEAGALPLTPIGINIRGLKLSLSGEEGNILARVLAEKKPVQIIQDTLAGMPERFMEAFKPALPMVAAPLMTRDQVLGVIVADNKFTHSPITEEDRETLMAFANTAAIAIDNSRRFEAMEAETRDRQLLQRISTDLSAKIVLDEILSALIEGGKALLGVDMAVVHMLDERTGTFQSRCAPAEMEALFTKPRRESGLTWEIMRTGNSIVIPDTEINPGVNLEVKKAGIRSLVGLPLMVQGKVIGALFFNSTVPQRFDEREVELISLLVSQAAVAIENGRSFQEVERNTRLMTSLVNVSQKLTETHELDEQLEIVRDFAVEDFNAPMFFIGIYDRDSDSIDFKLVEENGRRLEVPIASLAQKDSWGVAGYVVKKKKLIQWYSTEEKKLVMRRRQFQTRQVGQACESCLVVPLETGGEVIGVISIQNNQPHAWGENELNAFQTLARLAAIAMQNSKLLANLVSVANDNASLLQQVSRAKRASDVVVEVIALGKDIKETLISVVEGTRTATNCNAVLLYVYNQESERLEHPPTMVGVKFPDKTQRFGKVSDYSIVYKMLWQETPYYISENNQEDPLFKERRFSIEEGIASCIALPLRVGEQRVGVMFVNYWERHRFTSIEIATIQVLANQAAVAIRNAQLYDELQKRVKALNALNEAARRSVTGTPVIADILNRIAEQAYQITGQTGDYASNVSVVRLKEGKAVYEAAYPAQDLEKIFTRLGKEIDLERGIGGRIGVIGRTIKTGLPQLVDDVEGDPDYLISHPETRSEVTVPIVFGKKVVGVINAEHPKVGAFNNEDVRDLQILASYAAIAIEYAEQFKYLTELKGFIGQTTAVEWIRMVSKNWTHDINKEVGIARLEIEGLRNKIELKDRKISHPFRSLDQAINRISDIPITAPLSYEDAIGQIGINSLVKTYLSRQWDHYPYSRIPQPGLDLQPDLDDMASVRTSPEWLRRALEILVENAVQAMLEADSPVKQLTVQTRLVEDRIQIRIKDTGPGIPEKYLNHLFTKTKDGTKGTGIGLVLANTIIQTYYGSLELCATGSEGTEIMISLPIEKQ